MRALATLAPLSALCGIVTAFVFRRFGSSHTRRTVNRILAHVLELRLFLDEPRLIWNAQRDLLRENLRLFGQIALPSLIAAPLLGLIMWPVSYTHLAPGLESSHHPQHRLRLLATHGPPQ